jgi:hypothetical protein
MFPPSTVVTSAVVLSASAWARNACGRATHLERIMLRRNAPL